MSDVTVLMPAFWGMLLNKVLGKTPQRQLLSRFWLRIHQEIFSMWVSVHGADVKLCFDEAMTVWRAGGIISALVLEDVCAN